MALQDSLNPNLDAATENELFQSAFSWEPKRQHQFIMEVGGIPSYLIKTSAKPSMTNGEVALDHINIKRYVKGKSEWNQIEVTLYDAIVPSGAGRDVYSSFYKKEIRLHQLSPLGEVIEEWILKGAFIVDSNFGTFDWSQDAVQEISMTLRYDWAFLNF